MSTSSIDPRIRARRIAVQRDEGRKRLRRVTVIGGAVALGASLWGLAMTPLFDVDHVRVGGAGTTGVDEVRAATGITRGDPLLTADLGEAADRIAALPWVQTVEVTRRWPGTVEVDVVERTATAAVPAEAGGWLLLDREGRQLTVVPEPAAGLLRIEVRPVTPTIGGTLDADAGAPLALAASMPASLRERLVALEPAPGGHVEGTVRLPDGTEATVLFGRPTQAPAKWLALLGILEGVDTADLARIDVRVPSAPALTRG